VDLVSGRVDRQYSAGIHDVVFKGKWYPWLLADELTVRGIATGSALKALPDRLTETLLLSLDFGEDWAAYFRDAVARIVALTT
jgi:hypothetical protein